MTKRLFGIILIVLVFILIVLALQNSRGGERIFGGDQSSSIDLVDLDLRGDGDSAAEKFVENDDDIFALKWRNRYLTARVKYLNGQVADKTKGTETDLPKLLPWTEDMKDPDDIDSLEKMNAILARNVKTLEEFLANLP